MFNLNLSIDPSFLETKLDKQVIVSGDQMEYSASSTSSVVNMDTLSTAGDHEDSFSNQFFDIWNVEKPTDGYVMKDLFPESYREVVEIAVSQVKKKSRRGPRSRSSQYRGVTFYRRTGRWESHIWDCGKQVYLGGFDTAHSAARAYDRAAIKFRGLDADINFNVSDYSEELKQMKNLTKEEFVHILRRQSTGFSRGSSKYRGVTLHKCGRWEARMGQFLGKKYIYLGLFDDEIEAARAYDKAAIKCNGREAITNFETSAYEEEMSLHADIGAEEHHDLDLNLGIAPPQNMVDGGFQLHSASNNPHDIGIKDSTSSPVDAHRSHVNVNGCEHPFIWSEVDSVYHPVYKGTAIEKSMGVKQSQPFSTAASSGFGNSSFVTNSAAIHQLQFSSIPRNQYAPQISDRNNGSYYSWRQ